MWCPTCQADVVTEARTQSRGLVCAHCQTRLLLDHEQSLAESLEENSLKAPEAAAEVLARWSAERLVEPLTVSADRAASEFAANAARPSSRFFQLPPLPAVRPLEPMELVAALPGSSSQTVLAPHESLSPNQDIETAQVSPATSQTAEQATTWRVDEVHPTAQSAGPYLARPIGAEEAKDRSQAAPTESEGSQAWKDEVARLTSINRRLQQKLRSSRQELNLTRELMRSRTASGNPGSSRPFDDATSRAAGESAAVARSESLRHSEPTIAEAGARNTGALHMGPVHAVASNAAADWLAVAGELCAYCGIIVLTVGACSVIWSRYGGPPHTGPWGWLLTVVGQLLTLSGVVSLISANMDQTRSRLRQLALIENSSDTAARNSARASMSARRVEKPASPAGLGPHRGRRVSQRYRRAFVRSRRAVRSRTGLVRPGTGVWLLRRLEHETADLLLPLSAGQNPSLTTPPIARLDALGLLDDEAATR